MLQAEHGPSIRFNPLVKPRYVYRAEEDDFKRIFARVRVSRRVKARERFKSQFVLEFCHSRNLLRSSRKAYTSGRFDKRLKFL